MTKILIGIDIGSSNITIIAAEAEITGSSFKIIATGSSPSEGITKGIVDNIEKASRSVQSVYGQISEYLENQECEVFVNTSGIQIRSLNSKGLETMKEYREVNVADVGRAISRAKGLALPNNRVVLDFIPQYFSLDGNVQVKDPIGMTGVRLETLVHIVTAEHSALQNISKVLEFLPYMHEQPVINSLASSYAVLEENEKELGVALVDIGGGITDVSVFIEGSVRQTIVIPLGGNSISKDIAIGIKTSFEEAEKIKIKHGLCVDFGEAEKKEITVPGLGDQQERVVVQKTLVEIIEPRLREIFMMVAAELERNNLLMRLGAGIVFTGGGSLITGTTDFAKRFFQDLPVRIGRSNLLDAFKSNMKDNVSYSTAVGLVHYGCLKSKSEFISKKSKRKVRLKHKSIWSNLKDIFKSIM